MRAERATVRPLDRPDTDGPSVTVPDERIAGARRPRGEAAAWR